MSKLKEKTDTPQGEFRDVREELAFLRQKFGSMVLRGHYKECFKQIEDNFKKLYFQERWPENFHSCLLLQRRCFPSMDIDGSYDAYLEKQLRKNGIPLVFSSLLGEGKSIIWTSESFKARALRCREAGQNEEALDYADLMIKTDPLSSSAYLLRGWILQDIGRADDATSSFERAVELNRSNYQASAALAGIYASKDPEKALNFIDQAIEQQPKEAGLRAAKGGVLFGMGKTDEALACLDEANYLDPLSAEYVYEKARVLDKMEGQEIAAIRQYRKVLVLSESHLPALRRLAELLFENQPDLALSYIGKVAAAEPEDKAACLLKARLLDKTVGGKSAVRQHEAYLEMDSGSAEAHGAIGRLLLDESPEQALSHFEKAAELAPEGADYYIGQGQCHLKMENRHAAVKAYQEAVRRDKSSSRAQAALGYLYLDDDPKTALGYFNAALRLDPENARYYQTKGEILSKLPDSAPGDILSCIDKAARLDPGNAELQLALAKLLEKAGNFTSAVSSYKTAAGLSPSLEEAHLGLARLLMESEPRSALGSINHAIGLNSGRAEYYYLKSRIYSNLAGSTEELRGLRRSLSIDSYNPDSLQELRQLVDGDAPRVAMMYINRALELSPRNADYLCVRAGLLAELGEKENAIRQYELALERDGECHPAHFGLGELLTSDTKKAEEHFDRAIALAPAQARYHAGKAALLARDPERYPEALQCFDEALAINTHMSDTALAKARLLEEHGELFTAMDYYRRALLIDADCLDASVRMAALLTELNPKAALTYIDKAIALDPGDYTNYIRRGRILHEMGNHDGRDEAIRQAVSLGGETEDVYYQLAITLRRSLPDEALGYCSRAMTLSPRNAAYPLLCGEICRDTEREAQAKSFYAEALNLNPECHEALARTAELLYSEGKMAESLALIGRAIDLRGEAFYYRIRSLILFAMDPSDLAGAAECAAKAIRLAPGNLEYHEWLLTILKKSGAHIRHFREKQKTDRLRRALSQAEAAARAE